MSMMGVDKAASMQSAALLDEGVNAGEAEPEAIIPDLAENSEVPLGHLRQAAGCLNVLAKYGLEKASMWELAKIWKEYRIKAVGYREYLHEVLGTGVNCRLVDCRLWRGEEELDIANLSYWPGKPLIEYLFFLAESSDSIDELPDRVQVNRGGGKKLTSYI